MKPRYAKSAQYDSPDGLPDEEIETDQFDDDTNREESEEKPFVYSPFSPYYNLTKTKLKINIMKVKSLQFNWHQVGSVTDRDGSGENYHLYEVGKNHVHEIVEYIPTMAGEVWNYKVFLEDGTIYRVFNPNFVEYFKEEIEMPDYMKDPDMKELFEGLNPNKP